MEVCWKLFITWFKMGLFTIGGGYAMLPYIQKEVVERYGWATEEEVLDYYALGQATPGIIAVNTATFIGYKVKGTIGAICATLGIISPSLIIITLISSLISTYTEIEIVQNAIHGVQVAVCVLMAGTIIRMCQKNLKESVDYLIMIAAFLLAYFTNIQMMFLVILAGIIGIVLMKTKIKKEDNA